jgi:3-hydroxyacyl-[acyl-carrier-protein] dehydratase
MRFFLIDRITTWDVGIAAEAIKNVALSEDFFDDHFPRRPVMPGVLILEGKALLTLLERTKFRALVRPGDSLLYRAEVLSIYTSGGKVSGRASCNGRTVATTAMVFAFKFIDDPLLESRRAALMKTWMPPG